MEYDTDNALEFSVYVNCKISLNWLYLKDIKKSSSAKELIFLNTLIKHNKQVN